MGRSDLRERIKRAWECKCMALVKPVLQVQHHTWCELSGCRAPECMAWHVRGTWFKHRMSQSERLEHGHVISEMNISFKAHKCRIGLGSIAEIRFVLEHVNLCTCGILQNVDRTPTVYMLSKLLHLSGS